MTRDCRGNMIKPINQTEYLFFLIGQIKYLYDQHPERIRTDVNARILKHDIKRATFLCLKSRV